MSAPNRTTTSTVADQTAQPTSQQTSQPSWPLSPYQVQMSYAASPSGAQSPGQSPPSAGIARGSGADWFGPLNPLNPIAPPDIAGRRFDFPVGYNLVIRPRAYEPVGFHELRAFADAYDLLRLVIETRKDQMERQRWRIRPRDPHLSLPRLGGREGRGRGAAIDADMSARIAAVERFFQKPDGVTRWKTWLRSLLEDMFVIDAATLYCQRTRSGQLFALQQLDGATIKRVIDDWGRTPQPYRNPNPPPLVGEGGEGEWVFPPAYQQVLKGLPAVNYSARDIIYRPRNVRAHRVYGYSPVQQILMTVNIALRRQLWQLDYFTEGSIPDALIGVPQGWTPDQIKQFQDYWDTEFSGDLAKRRRAKFVPGDTAAKVVQTKEPQHKDDFDEWLARIICFAFSVPPQWAVKAMNRATADNQSAQAEEEGLEPTKEWVKDLVDEIIAEEFASPDLELVWLNEDDNDSGKAEAAFETRLKLGAVTLNELRDALGLDPYANPAADRPMVLTATGYVPIEANASGTSADTKDQDGFAIGKSKRDLISDFTGLDEIATILRKYGYNSEEPRIPKHHNGGGEWTNVAGSDDPNKASDAPDPGIPFQRYGRGHHWVTKKIFTKRKFSNEVKAFFDKARSGPLADSTVNHNTKEHRAYNDAVNDLLDEFLKKNNIAEEKMTLAQADEFVQEVKNSANPVIREFVMKINREVLRYGLRWIPWRRGGGGGDD